MSAYALREAVAADVPRLTEIYAHAVMNGTASYELVPPTEPEMLSRFDAGQVRSHRVGAIAGTSRNTRVTLYVNADRRYTFACAADGDGRIVTASFSPARPDGAQLAGAPR